MTSPRTLHPTRGRITRLLGGPVARHAPLLLILAVAGHALWYARESLFVDRGDAYADCFVLVAGQHFAEEGFAACRFLPVHQPGPLRSPPEVYTHYPPGPDWINGLERRLFGWESLLQFRVPPILLMLTGYCAWYAFCYRFWGANAAFFSLAFLCTRELNSDLIDNIHGHAYHEALRLLGMTLVVAATEKPASLLRFRLLWAVMFLNAWMSYESILDLQIFALGYMAWVGLERNGFRYAAVLAAPVSAFLLQQGINLLAVGPAHFTDLKNTLFHRVAGDPARNPGWVTDYLWLLAGRFDSLLGFPLWLLAPVFLVTLVLAARKEDPFWELSERGKVLILLFLAGISWWIVFPDHTRIHWFTFRHIAPFVAALFGWSAAVALARRRGTEFPASAPSALDGEAPLEPAEVPDTAGEPIDEGLSSPRDEPADDHQLTSRGRKTVAVLLAGALAFALCSKTLIRGTAPVLKTAEDPVFEQIRTATQLTDSVLTNWNRTPFIRLGAERRTHRVTTEDQLDKALHLRDQGENPALFAYREDRDHGRSASADPLYRALDERHPAEREGQWTLFDLTARKPETQSTSADTPPPAPE